MEISSKTMGALLFLMGVIVGRNYPKIEKQLQPAMKKLGNKSGDAYVAAVSFFASQKERVEDLLAQSKNNNANSVKRASVKKASVRKASVKRASVKKASA